MRNNMVNSSTAPHVVVVGSGPIGSAYAREILETHPTATVSMIEMGPHITEVDGTNVRNIPDVDTQTAARLASQGPRASTSPTLGSLPGGVASVEGTFTARAGTHLVDDGAPGSGHSRGMPAAALSTNVGGQGAHWTCATPRPVDDEVLAAIPAAELDDLLDDAESLLHVEKAALTTPITRAIAEHLTDVLGDALPNGRSIGPMPLAVTVPETGTLIWSGSNTVLGPLLDASTSLSGRFSLQARAQVRSLQMNGDSVTGVVVRDLESGAEHVEEADAVVVAADAIRTPQLLFASGLRPRALGHYLTEHPVLLSTIALRESLMEAAFPAGVPEEPRLATAAGDAVSAAIRIPYVEGSFPFGVQIMHVRTNPYPLPGNHPLAAQPFGYLHIGFTVRKFPRYEDAVTFSEHETDRYGMPNVTISYALTEREHIELDAARAQQSRAIHALGVVVPGGEPRLAANGASLHYMGTFRMGDQDDGTSVVDANSRVWGVNNLYLGGNGVIPTGNVVNPTLYSTALALRGARHLSHSLRDGALAGRPATKETA